MYFQKRLYSLKWLNAELSNPNVHPQTVYKLSFCPRAVFNIFYTGYTRSYTSGEINAVHWFPTLCKQETCDYVTFVAGGYQRAQHCLESRGPGWIPGATRFSEK
jgi:hypothetical protein